MDEIVFLYLSNVIIVTKVNTNRKPIAKRSRATKRKKKQHNNNTENENNIDMRVVTID